VHSASRSSFFVTANYIEAGLWTVVGVGFLLHALLRRGGATSFIAAGAFLIFGLSDVIETRTGAWWRPWWLLAMKGSCLTVLLVLLARHVLAQRRRSAIPDTAHPQTSTHPSR
jgi:hypothetical protein